MTENKLYSKTKMSKMLGWSEGGGRRWVKEFEEYIPITVFNNRIMYDDESVRILKFLKDLNKSGLTMVEIKKWVVKNGIPENEGESKKVIAKNESKIVSHEFNPQIASTIPTVKELLIPYLNELKDGSPYTANELTQKIVKLYNLSERQQVMKYETNTDAIFLSRIRGVRYSLKKEGYINEINKLTYQITPDGLALLDENIVDIAEEVNEMEKLIDPLTAIKDNINDLHEQLSKDLLKTLSNLDWKKFEDIVVDLLTKMGYGDGEVTQRSNDEGLDGIIKEDKLGLENIYVQAKRYGMGNSVGREAVQSFSGALDAKGARKGVFITTSHFTDKAKAYADRLESKRIILIDGKELTNLMIAYNVGVNKKVSFVIKEIDFGYFDEE
ncbi:restriction endonuclease [Sporosarcina sp. FSL W7-1349]|uniref:restriction endonuclease n=1 Tax=Sporosarcina sp. FSL W7-1349 TaxID=2921561 RepID=UPI0030F857CE